MLYWAVLSVSMITILGSTAVSPALAGIKFAFPMYSDATIQLVLAIPPLFIIPSCLLCSSAVKRCGMKRILITGIILYLIGGMGAGIMPNFYMMIAARAVLGIACGFITPLAQILISAYFSGETKSRMTGYSASASYMMGILASIIVARLAAVNWRFSFIIYAVAIVVLLLNLKYLPMDHRQPLELLGNRARSRPPKNRVSKKSILIICGMGVVNVAFYTFTASISLFMLAESIGDKSASGSVVAVFMFSGFCMGMLVNPLRKIIGKYTVVIAALMMGGGYLLLSNVAVILGASLSAACIGGSYSIFYSDVFLKIGECARDGEENTRLVTYTTAAMFTGQVLSTYILRIAERLFQTSGYRFRFSVLAVGLFIAATLLGITLVKPYIRITIKKWIIDKEAKE